MDSRYNPGVYSLGFSPCPNDCFIFYALAHGKVALPLRAAVGLEPVGLEPARLEPVSLRPVRLEDVETLNQLARTGTLDVTKISYHAFFHLTDAYVMLRSGGALGHGVGPLIVTKEKFKDLSGRRVAVPGGLTTANLLLKLSHPGLETVTLRYDRIMPAVAAGEVDAGLIIHESRFTYPDYGLYEHLDLGSWWEQQTGLPLPLGGVMAKRTLGEGVLNALDDAILDSLRYAYAHPQETQPYIAAHAQELSERVRQQHIELYVNALSLDVGRVGEQAVRELQRRARDLGLVPGATEPLFISGEQRSAAP